VKDIRILPMRVQDTNARTNPHNDESEMRGKKRADQTSWDSSPFLPFFVALGRSSGWMNGTTPPWEMTTSPRSLFSLSERHVRRSHDWWETKNVLFVVADGELQVTGHDTLLLVVASGVTGELENLGSEVLEDGSEVDCSIVSARSRI
jgi:hypothetical protein